MLKIQKERIELGKLIDKCSECSLVPRVAKGTYDVKYCKSRCQHWIKLQNQRKVVEKLQMESRRNKCSVFL